MRVIIFTFLCLMSAGSYSATFYIDPINGSSSNDGSQELPWRTLQEVIENRLIESQRWSAPYSADSTLENVNVGAPVKAGDTLVLMSGYHGDIALDRYINAEDIVIQAGLNQTPTVSSIFIRSSARWVISGLSVSNSHSPIADFHTGVLVDVESHSFRGPSSEIRIIGNDIFSAPDVSHWSVEDWANLGSSGIDIAAENSTVANNTIYNIRFGITTFDDHAYVYGNSIINFAGDGMRGLGNYSEFNNNFVANAFDINGNHDDGFQSWSRNGQPVVGVILRNNHFITDFNHPNPALLSNFQGIGAFDGFYHDWIVENNVLQIEHWHGISLYGARNCTVINNTVIDYNDDPRMRPWIRINPHKNGTHGEGNIVRNNIGRIVIEDSGTVSDHNLSPSNAEFSNYFVGRNNFDLHLNAQSPAIGAGSFKKAPVQDADGTPRVKRIDAGAYQAR
ncbi:choice-of-anchor Q domain-containing protein [Sessilibacter corallicola]|uniref:Right handed beta helix domain-containing protein n=1 Tax=Sessilibacter corallicola TaxID=2904075 RepID=A0ABQ0ACI0_9GAMM